MKMFEKIFRNVLFAGVCFISFVSAQMQQHSAWIDHSRRPDPRWQLFPPQQQPTNYLTYGNYYELPKAPPLPTLPTFDQGNGPKTSPEIVQRQRNEGNFYKKASTTRRPTAKPTKAPNTKAVKSRKSQHEKLKTQLHNHSHSQGKSLGYAAFEHKVIHVTKPRKSDETEKDTRSRRSFQAPAANNQTEPIKRSEPKDTVERQEKRFHDIFMHYAGPQSVVFGHMEKLPGKFTKRFESLNKGNRYKGEISWHDALTGGYGFQHWDLAQGSLRNDDHEKSRATNSSLESNESINMT